ncbi:MAG: DnaD domain protein [Dehalococcoidales bacterium]|nr:DnaD domain protein [Dehalococcoidales bacterium]
MKKFDGFPVKMTFTPIPNTFINNLMPQIDDIDELKITLYIMEALYNKKGYPRFIAFSELAGNASLMSGFKKTGNSPGEALKKALDKAIERKTILHLSLEKDEDIYFLNTPADRQAVEKLQSGELKLTGAKTGIVTAVVAAEPVNIFALYEENIGMLTPMIAEELKDAINIYPETWIEDAIKEAVKQNARRWSYITAILERWSKEGRSDGAYRRDTKKDDPEKYTGGRYGRFVRH